MLMVPYTGRICSASHHSGTTTTIQDGSLDEYRNVRTSEFSPASYILSAHSRICHAVIYLTRDSRHAHCDYKICAVLIGICIPIMEGAKPIHALPDVGFMTFAANGAIAFALNVAGVFLIDSAGSLVLTLSGIFKVSLTPIERN
jgi:hypothetical protein